MFQYTRLSTRRYFAIVKYFDMNTDNVRRNQESVLWTETDDQEKLCCFKSSVVAGFRSFEFDKKYLAFLNCSVSGLTSIDSSYFIPQRSISFCQSIL